jgi:hypothetical protein
MPSSVSEAGSGTALVVLGIICSLDWEENEIVYVIPDVNTGVVEVYGDVSVTELVGGTPA